MVKNSPANAGDAVSVPGLGIYPGDENGNPLLYSCLGISWTEEPGELHTVYKVAKELDMTEQLNNNNK